MWGSATFTIVTSSTTMSCAPAITIKAITGFTCRRGRVRSARMSFVAWCVVVMGPRLGSIVEECQTIRSQKFMVDEHRGREYAHVMHTKAGQEAWRSMLDVLFSGQVHGRMQQACTTLGVPPGVLKLLMQLRPGVGVPMRELAEHFGFDASYLTGLADALEERGLVERRP